MSVLHRFATLLLALLVPVLLTLSATRLILNDTYLNIVYSRPDFPPDPFGFTQAERLAYAPVALRYLLGSDGVELLADLKSQNGQPLFSEREISHMIDVRNVMQAALTVLAAGWLLFGLISVILVRSAAGRLAWWRGLMGGALLHLGVLVSLLVYIMLDWDHFFDSFHNLFFAQGTWQFEYSDTLIRLFPIHFWQVAALTIGVISAVVAVVILLVSWRVQRTLLQRVSRSAS